MTLPTPSQSVSHKRFHQCVNHKKKLHLRHPLPTFGSFSFFQASLWLGVNKVHQKQTKSCKSELKHLFQCCILIPRTCPRKTPSQHTVPHPPPSQIFGPSATYVTSIHTSLKMLVWCCCFQFWPWALSLLLPTCVVVLFHGRVGIKQTNVETTQVCHKTGQIMLLFD